MGHEATGPPGDTHPAPSCRRPGQAGGRRQQGWPVAGPDRLDGNRRGRGGPAAAWYRLSPFPEEPSLPARPVSVRRRPIALVPLAIVIALGGAVVAGAVAGGDLDPGFNPNASDEVHAIAVQPDGKILIGGFFGSLNPGGSGPVTRSKIARLNADGTLDPGFNPDANSVVYAIATQPDGKILIGGNFTTLNPGGSGSVTRNHIARLNADGTLDPGFNPDANGRLYAFAVQADNRILIGGQFTGLNPGGSGFVTRSKIARLYADGTLDPGFNPDANSDIQVIATQPDGKILIGGNFTTLNPGGSGSVTRNRIARLNADGTPDMGFDPNANSLVSDIATHPDGKILIAGFFTALNPGGSGSVTRNRIARLNADGTLDMGFDPDANGTVYAIVPQSDGQILIGGDFTALNPGGSGSVTRNRIARLNADGTPDPGFNPNANSLVTDIATQPDGKVLIGGWFTSLNPGGSGSVGRVRIARLLGGPPIASPTAVGAVAGDGQATVAWTGIVGDILSYTATATPGGGHCTAMAPSLTCTVTGLTGGTAYTVTAANPFGHGPASSASAAVTTPTTPTASSPAPALTATLLPPRTRLTAGQSLRIGVRVVNTGTATASSVISCMVLPIGIVKVQPAGAKRATRTLCFRQGDPAPGRTATSRVTVRATAVRKQVKRTLTGSARATGVAPVKAAPRVLTITPRRG